MKKKIATWIGRILLVLSLIFIANKIYQYNMEWNMLLNPMIFGAVLVSILLHGLNIFAATFNYKNIISMIIGKKEQQKLDQKVITNIYCKSNLFKYLPGNVMHYIGRNQIAVDLSLSHADVGVATAFEMMSLVISGGIITFICSAKYFVEYLKLLEIKITYVVIVLGILLIVIGSFGFLLRRKIVQAIKKYIVVLEKENRKDLVVALLCTGARLIVNALIFIFIMFFFGLKIPSIELFFTIVGIFIMSWVIGFLTPGAPGGLGVREFIMTVFLTGIFQEDILLLVLLVYRVVCILGDMISYCYAFIANKYL